MNWLWIVLIIIYIISPFDAHPLFMDDLLASGVLLYMLYKNAKRKHQQQQYHDYYSRSQDYQQSQQETGSGQQGPLTLDEAYDLLGVSRKASMEEINRAYKEKMAKSHPDKVSHLSDELQEKAKELTLKLNEAYDLIKRHR